MQTIRNWQPFAVAGLLGLTALAWWQISRSPLLQENRLVEVLQPEGIMGTSSTIIAVNLKGASASDNASGREAVEATAHLLSQLEGFLSTWMELTEVSRLNSAPANTEIPLSPHSRAVLAEAQALYAQTQGAFDITAGPLFRLWREAARARRLPTSDEIHQARQSSTWDHLTLTESGAIKSVATARIDIDGLAKGYAIDQALEFMLGTGVKGGLVDVGGDMRFAGLPPEGDSWQIDLRDPAGKGILATLAISRNAVATSGNYARYTTVNGKRYSHILDPRTGQPTDHVPSATVVGPDAMRTDAWATALSVLGPAGFSLLPEGFEALLILNQNDLLEVHKTPGFPTFSNIPEDSILR